MANWNHLSKIVCHNLAHIEVEMAAEFLYNAIEKMSVVVLKLHDFNLSS